MASQKKNVNMNRLFQMLFEIGAIIGDFFIMQFYFIIYSFKGGILLGVFPAISCVFKVFFKWFNDWDEAIKISVVFSENWKKHFKIANQVGYTLIAIFAFLYADIRINRELIQSSFLHMLLLVIMGVVGFLTIYTFTVMIGHGLSYKEIFKQSFFVSFATPIFTIAAVIAFVLMAYLLWLVELIFLLIGIPSLVAPIAWFTYTGLEKVDKLKEKYNKQN